MTAPLTPDSRTPSLAAAALAAAAFGFALAVPALQADPPPADAGAAETADAPPADGAENNRATAIFAGGCFWCMEAPFDKLDGVISTTSGYTAGRLEDPTYRQVSTGRTGHTEAVKIVYDPKKVDYETLLQMFWRNVDPFQRNQQFVDRGTQYRTGIYYDSPEQQAAVEASRKEVEERFGRKVQTEIDEAGEFYDAEAYHQDFYLNNPLHYNNYHATCGRVPGLKKIWGEEAGGMQILKAHNAKAAAAEAK